MPLVKGSSTKTVPNHANKQSYPVVLNRGTNIANKWLTKINNVYTLIITKPH